MKAIASLIVSLFFFSAIAVAAPHKSTLFLATGEWTGGGGTPVVFQPFEVSTGQKFHVSGCGFVNSWAGGGGGESQFSGDPRPNYIYGYDSDVNGCIVPGGSSTYTAPAKPGWYSIIFWTFDPNPPFGKINEGIFWFRVKK